MKVQAPAGSKVTVYNMKTGQADQCFAIDAQERINRGGWSLEPVGVQEVEDETTPLDELQDQDQSQPDSEQNSEQKKKPGRKPKSA